MTAAVTRKPKPERRGKHSREVCIAPAPEACTHCRGAAVEPDEEGAVVPCLQCNGLGVEPVARFDLLHTRAYELRRVRYEPTCSSAGGLTIGIAVKETRAIDWGRYELTEFDNDWGGRAFALRKTNATDPQDEIRHVFVGRAEKRCSCPGMTFMVTARANQIAWDEGREVFYSAGCKHLDAVEALLEGGWLNI